MMSGFPCRFVNCLLVLCPSIECALGGFGCRLFQEKQPNAIAERLIEL